MQLPYDHDHDSPYFRYILVFAVLYSDIYLHLHAYWTILSRQGSICFTKRGGYCEKGSFYSIVCNFFLVRFIIFTLSPRHITALWYYLLLHFLNVQTTYGSLLSLSTKTFEYIDWLFGVWWRLSKWNISQFLPAF